ncbi:MAG: hypothetical protein ABSF99_01280 [Anaerolineales bacterium]|jgi:hypothetical protein
MTEPERAALEHIRQVVDSVIGASAPPEPATPEPVTPEPTTTEPAPAETLPSILPVPYFSQAGDEANLPTNDSGSASGVMLVRAYNGADIIPADFYNQAGQSAGNALSFTQIMNALSANGVPVELRSNLKLADLPLILFSGRPVITPIQQAVLQQAGLSPDIFKGPYYVVVVGMDMKQVFIYDPLRQDASGQAQGIPWLTFYQAWTQAQGYERAVLVPRKQLVRRVRVTANLLDVFEQPGGVDAIPAGTVSLGEVFEVTTQKSGWGKISEDRWINLSSTADI